MHIQTLIFNSLVTRIQYFGLIATTSKELRTLQDEVTRTQFFGLNSNKSKGLRTANHGVTRT